MKPNIGQAMVEFILNTRPRRTNPAIESLSFTSDGFAIARLSGAQARQSESGAFLGNAEALINCAEAYAMTRAEYRHRNMRALIKARVDDWRR